MARSESMSYTKSRGKAKPSGQGASVQVLVQTSNIQNSSPLVSTSIRSEPGSNVAMPVQPLNGYRWSGGPGRLGVEPGGQVEPVVAVDSVVGATVGSMSVIHSPVATSKAKTPSAQPGTRIRSFTAS